MARYFKICPRGFANEVTYVRILDENQAAKIEEEYASFEDDNPNAYARWTNDARASMPGVAVSFEDRNRL
jgi:hypothetical protein